MNNEADTAIYRLFLYLDCVRPDAPRNLIDPYQVDTEGSYSFKDLRMVRDELIRTRNELTATKDLVKQIQDNHIDREDREKHSWL